MNTDTTAMRHGITTLRKVAKISSNEYYQNGLLYAAQYLEDELLSKEKEQIVNAYNSGYRDAEPDNDDNDDVSDYADAEIYFNQTYNTK